MEVNIFDVDKKILNIFKKNVDDIQYILKEIQDLEELAKDVKESSISNDLRKKIDELGVRKKN